MTKHYPPGCDTPELRRAWDTRMRPIADVVREVLGDEGLSITVQRYRPDPAEFERAWSEAVSQMSAEQLIDVAKFMTTAAEPTDTEGGTNP